MKLRNDSKSFPIRYNGAEVIVEQGFKEYEENVSKHILHLAKMWDKSVYRADKAPDNITEGDDEETRQIKAKTAAMKIDDLRLEAEKGGLSPDGTQKELVQAVQELRLNKLKAEKKPKEEVKTKAPKEPEVKETEKVITKDEVK